MCVCVCAVYGNIFHNGSVCVFGGGWGSGGGCTLGHEAEWSVAKWDLEHPSLPALLIRSSNCNANAHFLTLI